jgi:hypothetical protein
VADLTHLDQGLARAIGAGHAKAVQARDLRRSQGGKHLVAPRVHNRWDWLRHSSPLEEAAFDLHNICQCTGPMALIITCNLDASDKLTPAVRPTRPRH